MERQSAKLLGYRIDTFNFESAVEYAKNLILSGQGGQVVTINPEMIELGDKNPYFSDILHNADLVIPDGIGIKIGLKIKGHNAQRIAGIEFSHKLIEECAKNGIPVGLLGAKPEIIEKASQNLKKEFENLNLVYVQDGYFKNSEEIISQLKEKNPHLLLVALGAPKQEEFIAQARKTLPNTLMIGVGGSFDVWSGEVQRAPMIWQKLCLEWLYRTIKEPQRFKRIFPTLPVFLLKVLKSKSEE